MNNKYYTPSIEEFYQGFEYERWVNSAYTPEKYSKEIFQFVDKDNIWNEDITNRLACVYSGGDSIRVKYIDKEDIESLGWIYNDISKEFNYKFKKEFNYRLWFSPNNPDLFSIRIEGWYSREGKIDAKFDMFLGNLKNKSELKKLMQQLHIL